MQSGRAEIPGDSSPHQVVQAPSTQATGENAVYEVLLQVTGSAAVEIGGSGVAHNQGFPVAAGGSVGLQIGSGDAVYAVATAGTEVAWLLSAEHL